MGLVDKNYPIFFNPNLPQSATGRASDEVVTPSVTRLYIVRLKNGLIREEATTLKTLTLVITNSLTTDTIALKNVMFGLFL
jgi:hypothetical protein